MKKLIFITCLVISFTNSCSNAKNKDTDPNVIIADNDSTKLIDKYLSDLAVKKYFSGGLLIIKNGIRIFSKGYGWANKENKIPFTPSTLASMGSITKAFTAAAIMKLKEQGKISLTDPLKKFFPAVPADKSVITIHQLLTHSSGFHEFLKNDGGDYEKIETGEFLKRAFTEPLAFKPREKAVYTNVGMSILGIIIEQVSGMSYESFLKKYLFDPAGIGGIGYHIIPAVKDRIAHGYQNGKDWGTIPQHIAAKGGGPYWNLKANGGLEASLDDIFLWANAMTNSRILNDSSIQQMFTAQIQEEGYDGQSSFGYGCNIYKSRRNTKVIDNGGSNGIYFSRMLRLPEEGLVFYMVTNESTVNTNKVLPNVTQLYFEGKIVQDVLTMQPGFETQKAAKIYQILTENKPADLAEALKMENIVVDDDMILLEVGQRLIEEKKADEALSLYQYYTKSFPNIIVSWNDLGDVYLMKNNKEEAASCYKQALKLRPGNQRAKENLEKINK